MTTPTPPSPAAAAAGNPPAGHAPAGGRHGTGLPVSKTTLAIGGTAVVVGVGWYWYKSRKSSSAAAAGSASSAGTLTGECSDANGNPTPCEDMAGVDYSGQLSVLQTELESIAAAGGTGAATGAASSTGTTTTTTAVPATPAGFHTTKVATTSVGLAWTAVTGATGYVIRVTYQSQLAKQFTAGNSTSYTVSGLTPDHTYGFHVIATNTAGWSPEASISQKTPKS